MFSKTSAIILTAAAFAGKVLAGEAIIVNNCPYDVYAYSVDYDNRFPPEFTITKGTTHKEPIRTPSNYGGVSIKINTISTAKVGMPQNPITQLEYTVAPKVKPNQPPSELPDMIYYDISFVDCATAPNTGAEKCPIWKDGLTSVCDADDGCKKFVCPPGIDCPEAAYYDPTATLRFSTNPPLFDEPNSAVVGLDRSIRFTLCQSPVVPKPFVA